MNDPAVSLAAPGFYWRTTLRGALPRLAIGAVLGGAALWLAFRGVEAEAVWAALGRVNYAWVAVAQVSVLGTLLLWQRRITSRRELARLDERLLADAAISLHERAAEVSKPFWR